MATTPTRAVPGCAKKRVSTMSRKEKEMTINVWNYMRKIYPEETEESITSQTSKATGFSVRSVERIKLDEKKSQSLTVQEEAKCVGSKTD